MLTTTQRSLWLFCAAFSILPSIAFAESGDSRSEWPMFGQNVQNTASSDVERKISTSNVATLAPKWVATTGGDVSARGAVVGGVVYFPDWGGNVWALDAKNGRGHLAAPAVRLRLARWHRLAHEPGGARRQRLYRHRGGSLSARDQRKNRRSALEDTARLEHGGGLNRLACGSRWGRVHRGERNSGRSSGSQ